MKIVPLVMCAAVVSLAGCSCGAGDVPAGDAGQRADAGEAVGRTDGGGDGLADGGGEGDAGSTVDDAGRGADAGDELDAGEPIADAGAQPGEDAGVDADAGAAVDAGPIDAGPTGAYTGEPEEGVVCGDQTCTEQEVCCASIGQSPSCEDSCSGATTGELACDGPEDCPAEGEVCCVTRLIPPPATSCEEASVCDDDDQRACNEDADCPAGELCCPTPFTTVDMGVCATTCFGS